jgi:2-hydroxychromene-2-carboxylate isomerase
MGDVISLADAREGRVGRPRRDPRAATFFFDVGSPWTYLAAERAERLFAGIEWRPATGDVLLGARGGPDPSNVPARAAAERRAAELCLPLVWPEGWPLGGRSAMRVAALAAEQHRGAPYVLAAGRLAFCGGYDLDDPEVIAEAAAAAGLGLDAALSAAGELRRDGPMERTAMRLLRRGADELPVVGVGRRLFVGEGRLAEAAAAATTPRRGRPGRRGARFA